MKIIAGLLILLVVIVAGCGYKQVPQQVAEDTSDTMNAQLDTVAKSVKQADEDEATIADNTDIGKDMDSVEIPANTGTDKSDNTLDADVAGLNSDLSDLNLNTDDLDLDLDFDVSI